MNYFDANTWTGRWPFAFLDDHTPRTLAAHLRQHGIDRALVSPLDAVFAPEPGPANRALLRTTKAYAALVPVPVINPALANWREELKINAADPRVRAVRLLPSYHNYSLKLRAVDQLIEELAYAGLRLIVQVRLVDERHEFHAMNLKPVAVTSLVRLLERHADFPLLASGLSRSEILPLLPKYPQLLADLSFAEWHETMSHLLEKVPVQQLIFATHTPFMITGAALARLTGSAVPAKKIQVVAQKNLELFLQP